MIVHHLNKVSSRSNFVNEYTPDCEGAGTSVNEFVGKDSVVAVAAPDKHTDTVWFIMVTSDEVTMNKSIVDGYGNTIAAGQAFSQDGFWSEQQVKLFMFFQIKKTYFFKEIVVYSFLQVIPNKKASL